jgi:hypothetical protein
VRIKKWGLLFALEFLLFATSAFAISPGDLSALIQAAEQTDPLPPESLPSFGTFYSVQNPANPPMPINLQNLSGWILDNNGDFLRTLPGGQLPDPTIFAAPPIADAAIDADSIFPAANRDEQEHLQR